MWLSEIGTVTCTSHNTDVYTYIHHRQPLICYYWISQLMHVHVHVHVVANTCRYGQANTCPCTCSYGQANTCTVHVVMVRLVHVVTCSYGQSNTCTCSYGQSGAFPT